ncbi:MAG: hypothetical protein ABJ360_20255 [Roseobacter sp.]
MTETADKILSNFMPLGLWDIGSPGIAVGNEMAIFEAAQYPCQSSVEGEIVVCRRNIMFRAFEERSGDL